MNTLQTQLQKINTQNSELVNNRLLCNFNNTNEEIHNINNLRRGQIYLADLGNYVEDNFNANPFNRFKTPQQRTGVQKGKRPVLIISNEKSLKFSGVITVIPLTSNINKTQIPTHVFIGTDSGLERDSLIMCEQLITLDKFNLIHYICDTPLEVMKQVEKAYKLQGGIKENQPKEIITEKVVEKIVKIKDDTPNYNYINCMIRNILDTEEIVYELGDIKNKKIIDKWLNKKLKYTDELETYCDKHGVDYIKLLDEKRDELITHDESINSKIIYLPNAACI